MTKLQNFLNGKWFVPTVIVLVAVIGFCLGRISGLEEKREPVRVLTNTPQLSNSVSASANTAAVSASLETSSGQVVASKNGTKYHYSWCAGAKQIAEKNKIYFASIEDARAAGLTPASNCKGLK